MKINVSCFNISFSSIDIIKLNKTLINKQKIETLIEFLNKYSSIYKLKLNRVKKSMNAMIVITILTEKSIKLLFKVNMIKKTRKKKTNENDQREYRFAYERVLIETVTKQHEENEIKKKKEVRQKKRNLRSKKWSRSRKNEFTWKKWLVEKKNESQNNKRIRKDFKIQTSISQKIFSFCSYKAKIFDFSANICYFEEFDFFNTKNSNSQLYIFLRELFVRINEVLKRFWEMKMSEKEEMRKILKNCLFCIEMMRK